MTIEHIETAIIGAGQAGLATAYHLQRRERPCLILDGNARVGDNWRAHWDSLRLYTPAAANGLPGLAFPGPRWSFPTKDEVAEYLAAYAERFSLPVRTLARVDRLQAIDGKYVLRLGADSIVADNVVVATGTFGRTPSIPDLAVDLDPSIRQLHSSEYRKPAQLKPGSVLVVGGSHSGTDIAFELASTHPTVLAGRDPGQVPVRLDHWSARVVMPAIGFLAKHVLTPAHAHRPQSGRRGPVPRPTDVAGQAVRSASTRCGPHAGAGDWRSRRATGGRWCRSARRGECGVVHRLPPGVRLDRLAHLRRRWLAAGDAWRGVGRSGPVLLRARVPVRGRLNGVARGGQRCCLHCEADRHPSREATRPRSLSRLARISGFFVASVKRVRNTRAMPAGAGGDRVIARLHGALQAPDWLLRRSGEVRHSA